MKAYATDAKYGRQTSDGKPHWLRAIAGFTATIAVMTVLAVATVSLLDQREVREGRSASVPHSSALGHSAEKF